MKKKIKFNLENNAFNINDFHNHAIERNLTNKIKGGFPEVTFGELVDQCGNHAGYLEIG